MSIWDDKSLRPGGNYAKFENVGDNLNGSVVLDIGSHTWPATADRDERQVPKLTVRRPDGETIVWTVGQVNAISALFEARPEIGDTLTKAELVDIRKTGGKTYKDFEIVVRRAAEAASTPSADDLA